MKPWKCKYGTLPLRLKVDSCIFSLFHKAEQIPGGLESCIQKLNHRNHKKIKSQISIYKQKKKHGLIIYNKCLRILRIASHF